MKSKEQKYIKTSKLGEGTYGIVFRAKDQKGQEIYALKKIRLQADQEGIPSTAIREISLLKELNHINIVKLHEVLHSPKKLTLVFEYVDQDLKKVIDNKGKNGLSMNMVKSFLYQVLYHWQHLSPFLNLVRHIQILMLIFLLNEELHKVLLY